MKHTKIIVALATLLIAGTCSAADAFIRPFVIESSSPASGFNNATGFGAEVGGYLGANRHHEISLGIENYEHSLSANVSGLAESSVSDSITRCLLNYQYHFGSADLPIRFFTGPALGFTSAEVDVHTRVNASHSTVSIDAKATLSPVSMGWTTGATFRVTDRCSVIAGCRLLGTASKSVAITNGSISVTSHVTSSFFAGAEFRF